MTQKAENGMIDCTHYQITINVFQNQDEDDKKQKQVEESSSWSNKVLIDEDVSGIEQTPGHQELEQGAELRDDPSRVKMGTDTSMRSISPTTIIMDTSTEFEEEQKQEKEQNESNSTLRRSVSWREEIVTDVMYRPKTHSSEKRKFFYSSSDMQRFRQHFKMQVRAAQDFQKQLRKDAKMDNKGDEIIINCESSNSNITRKQQQHLYTSPITSLIDKITGFLATTSTSSSSASNCTNLNTAVSRGPIVETCVLVDTLYLF